MKFTPLFFFAIASAVDEIDDATLLQTKYSTSNHESIEDPDDVSQLQVRATRHAQNMSEFDDEESDEVGTSCEAKLSDALGQVVECMTGNPMQEDAISNYYTQYHGVSRDTFRSMWSDIAQSDALKIIQREGECDAVADLNMDLEQVDFAHHKAKRAVKHLVDLYLEILEDPHNDQYILSHFGSERLATMWAESTHAFQQICEVNSDDLMEVKLGCLDHANLDAFMNYVKTNSDAGDHPSCSGQQTSALLQHHHQRNHRNYLRARLVQVLHTPENKLGEYFHKHLKYGGSERNMEILIADAAVGQLTPKQRHMLLHLDSVTPHENLQGHCDKWSEQRDTYHDDADLRNNVLLNNEVYRTYMDCMCGNDEPKVVCQGAFLRDVNGVKKAIQKRQGELLAESDAQSRALVASEANMSVSGVPAGIGPCLLSDAFSCEVCLSSACVPFASRPRKTGQKNTNQEGGPFVVIKNALTAKAHDFKISCTACASLHPGEQISFEVEMYASTNFASLDSLFTNTKIGIDAKTCIGPGSPLRVIFDTLGINACKSNLKAEYLPFLGDLDVEGAIPGPIGGTWLEATFGTRIHDPPGAVREYCTDRPRTQVHTYRRRRWMGYRRRWWTTQVAGGGFDQACYDGYKNKAGPLMFSAACTVPLLVTNHKFELVKVSGPHTSGSRWQVELFQLPFEDVAQAIKDLWDNHAGPAMEKALNEVGDGITAAGDWTVGAANAAGDWTVGAANDAAEWTSGAANDAVEWTGGAVNTVAQAASPVTAPIASAAQSVGNFFSGFR